MPLTRDETLAKIRERAYTIHADLEPSEIDDPTIPQSPAWYQAQARAYADGHVPLRYRRAETGHPDVLAWTLNYLDDPLNCPTLLLAGPTGTGKTHQAYAALRMLAEARIRFTPWYAYSSAELYAQLRPATGRDTEKTFADILGASLLFIDDLGAAKSSEWTEEVTYRIIDGRYNRCLPMIVTTNVPIPQLAERIGDRCASRLAETSVRVVLSGPDRRRAKAAA